MARRFHGGTVSIDGTLDSTGGSAITEANLEIGDHGVVESTHGGVLTIDPHGAVGITNTAPGSDGGEIDIIHEAVSNADTLQAVDGGTMKLESRPSPTRSMAKSRPGQNRCWTWWTPSSRAVPSISTARWIRPATAPIDGAHIVNSGLLEVTGAR